jgi:hypothetical protein
MKLAFSLLAVFALRGATADIACVTDFETGDNVDRYPDKAVLSHFDSASIDYYSNFKVITGSTGKRTCVYKCGTTMPTAYLSGGANETYCDTIYTPQTGKVAIGSADQIAIMAQLGLLTNIVLAMTKGSDIANQCALDMIAAGTMLNTQPDGSEYTNAWDFTPDTSHVNSQIELTFSSSPSENETLSKNAVDIVAWLDPTLLAMPETMVLVGALLDQEFIANQVYNNHITRIECLSNNVEVLKSVYPESFGGKTVLWAYYSTYGPGWDIATCKHNAGGLGEVGPFYCEAAKVLDIDLLNSTEGSIENFGTYMTDAEFELFGKDADVWIYPADFNKTAMDIQFPFIKDFKSYKDQKIFDNTLRGNDDYFETFPSMPSAFVTDLAGMVYDNMLVLDGDNGVNSLVFWRNVFTETSQGWGACKPGRLSLLSDQCILISEVSLLDGSAYSNVAGAAALVVAAGAAAFAML